MTKLDLLARAKSLGIKGRHDMSKVDLETAVRQREMIAQVSESAKQAASEVKAASSGIKPRGSNLNDPWQRKFYFVDEVAYAEAKSDGRLDSAPMQVRLMLKFMVTTGIVSKAQAQQGSSVASVAVSTGKLISKIEPAVLFAYYRRKMESLGLVFAGYNLGGEDEDEVDADAEIDADTDETEEGEE